MGKYTRNCDNDRTGGGEVALMEVAEIENSGSAKRRKVGNGELRLSSSKSVRFTARDSEEDDNQSDDVTEGDLPASCCSTNGSITAKVNSTDLEAEIETTVRRNSDRNKSIPTSELKEEKSSKMESKSPAVIADSRRTILPEKMPPATEIEEFFAKAEKDLQKRFKDKYNYDIVKDVPLEGRFEWEKLKP